jgi:hypothetical protein
MHLLQKHFKGLFLGLLLLAVASCGGGGPGGGVCSFTTLVPPNTDLNGTWTVSEITSSSDPECDGETRTYQLEITVNGNDISAFSPDLGTTFTGEISGDEIRWSGSFPDGAGTTNVSCAELSVNSATSVSGTATWDFEEDDFTCSGTTAVTATKN